jgi:alpha-tubulin suppressor-like RCC1 family protein
VFVDVFSNEKKGVKVCAGDGFSVFLDEHGSVYTCGKGNFGRLGLGHCLSMSKTVKVEWFSKCGIKIKDIEVGGRHTLAISDEDIP